MREYNAFSKAAGLKTRPNRMRVVREESLKPQELEENPVTKALREGKIKLEINVGHQTKHIRGFHNFDPSRSEVYGTLEDAQKLVYEYAGKGEPVIIKGVWKNKERCEANHIIGKYKSADFPNGINTSKFLIHYGKNGTHIVPRI